MCSIRDHVQKLWNREYILDIRALKFMFNARLV
jgi:hypothetical protein